MNKALVSLGLQQKTCPRCCSKGLNLKSCGCKANLLTTQPCLPNLTSPSGHQLGASRSLTFLLHRHSQPSLLLVTTFVFQCLKPCMAHYIQSFFLRIRYPGLLLLLIFLQLLAHRSSTGKLRVLLLPVQFGVPQLHK